MAKVSYRRIVVAVDFSNPSKGALRHALGLAEQHGATLDVVYVIEESFHATLPWLKQSRDTVAHLRQEAVDAASARLARFVPKTDAVPVECIVRTGEVDEEVLRLVKRRHADLIVLGNVGRRRFGQLLLGSSASDILRRSTVPVLLIPVHR